LQKVASLFVCTQSTFHFFHHLSVAVINLLGSRLPFLKHLNDVVTQVLTYWEPYSLLSAGNSPHISPSSSAVLLLVHMFE
jgi:hypothetical protein